MTDTAPRRRAGGREARLAARAHAHVERQPFLTRKLAPFEVLDEEGLSLIEHNADTILQEVGLEFRGDPEALRTLRDAGADVQGERVRFPRGMCRQIVQATAPREFTQLARNAANSVRIGGRHTVLAPNYGSPFVRDLDRGRRYGTLEDFQNLVKLTYLSTSGTSTWSTRTSATATSRSWAPSPTRTGPATASSWPGSRGVASCRPRPR
jgi:trimethylamine--corrinoid protein Co-methyltransferase